MSHLSVVVFAALVGIMAMVQSGSSCNEAVCASLVSKCMLLKSCECDMTDKQNCTCCRSCHKCLAKLYTECCSCVEMCAKPNPKDSLDKTSTVEVLGDPIPELFGVLTDEEDKQKRWSVYTYPAHLDLLYFKPRGADIDIDLTLSTGSSEGHRIRHGNHHIIIDPKSEAMNCTVAYMSVCMSLSKCKASCESMGAMRYRWFHQHGCCECIGHTCLDYGKGEALCMKCPADDEIDEEEDYYYYEGNQDYHKKDQDPLDKDDDDVDDMNLVDDPDEVILQELIDNEKQMEKDTEEMDEKDKV